MMDNFIKQEHQDMKAEAQKIQDQFLAEKRNLKRQLVAGANEAKEVAVG